MKDDESDDLKRAQLLDHLEWLNELSQERNHKIEKIQELKPLVPVNTNNLSNTERDLESPASEEPQPVDGIGISEQIFIAHVENAFRDERNLSGPQQPLKPDYVEPEPTGRALPGNKEKARGTIEELLFGDAGNTPDFLQNIERFEIRLNPTRVEDSTNFAQEMSVADNLEQRQQAQLNQNSLSSPDRDRQFLDQQRDNNERRRLDDDCELNI